MNAAVNTAAGVRGFMPCIPADLTELDQWVLWRLEDVNGRPSKIPYQMNGRKASSTDPATWTSYEQVIAAKGYSGIGFVFTESDPFCGIDLDDCLDHNGDPKAWAAPIIERFGDTYMEVSPSGTGIKIWCKASLRQAAKFPYHDGAIEVYTKGRYFTVTARAFRGAPSQIEEHQASVEDLVALGKKDKPAPSVADGKIRNGNRHHYLVSLAGTMRNRGMAPNEIFAALLEVNRNRLEEPKPTEDVRRIAESAGKWEAPDWKANLLHSGDKVKANLSNTAEALENAPEWRGVIGRSDFTLCIEARKPTPWGKVGLWTDDDDFEACAWLQRNGLEVKSATVKEAVELVSARHRFHPVREYLESLTWDGDGRVDTWLTEYLGAEASNYMAAVGRRILLSAVARIFRPGCKADCMPVLEGPQGQYKSSALAALGGGWFADSLGDVTSKDSIMQLRGAWIIEVSEMESFNKADWGHVKAFLSRSTDRFRPPYGRRVIDAPRQCILAGTTNNPEWNRDATGARRFWPVRCGRIDLDRLKEDRDQLWAEALVLYRDGCPWWLETAELVTEARGHQEERFVRDVWQDRIEAWVARRDDAPITNALVLTECIGKPIEQCTRVDQNRVGDCLRAMGYERRRVRYGSKVEWRYVKEGE